MKLFERDKAKKQEITTPAVLVHQAVAFPQVITSLVVDVKTHDGGIQKAMGDDRMVVCVYPSAEGLGVSNQQWPTASSGKAPEPQRLFPLATRCRIIQVLKTNGGTMRVLLEGKDVIDLDQLDLRDGVVWASGRALDGDPNTERDRSLTLLKAVLSSFDRYQSLQPKIPKEVSTAVKNLDNPSRALNLLSGQLPLPRRDKLAIMAEKTLPEALECLIEAIEGECEMLELRQNISTRVRKRMEQQQKEHFLNEQIREMNKELGKGDDGDHGIEELSKALDAKGLPPEVHQRCANELKRLSRLQAMTPEAGIIRSYLEWIRDLPWTETSEDRSDIAEARTILDQDHYDMTDPKDRLVEHIAVRNLNPDHRGPILCLVGPPGTGKTSLGRSLARALGREFARISLGGVRDESEIRGHRRTYVGALPGKIIQTMRKLGTTNPVILLDEIDKMGSDHRGDPASAMLEVLDPEQNVSFSDHYMEVPYDLSQILFVTTANSLHNIPYALRDRLEVIEVPGYTRQEKLHIAQDFIIPKQLKSHGLEGLDLKFTRDAIETIIDSYTREAGVRNLERKISSVMRKLALEVVERGPDRLSYKATVNGKKLLKLLGPGPIRSTILETMERIGLARGMAWTEMGGSVLPVESLLSSGSGDPVLTGNLGEVMKESAKIAFTVVSTLDGYSSETKKLLESSRFHIHVPQGAIPKDGPSAGITLASSMYSALNQRAPAPLFAMTGELTLSGAVLPVGGIKDKVLAAHRTGMTNIILPIDNQSDEKDLPKDVLKSLDIHYVRTIEQVFEILFPRGGEN